MSAFEEHTENSFDAFRQTTVPPTVAERFGILVTVFNTISPDPFGESVKSSFVPVVISVVTPLKVSVPVVVIAPDAMVPAFVILPLLLFNPPVIEAPPPRVARPVPTVKVFDPVTDVAPLRETAPVPVENVPAPVWLTFPEVVIPVAPLIAPAEVIAIVGVFR